MGKHIIFICENKDADQLRGNREADQRLCFRYTDSIVTLLFKSEISSFQPASVTVKPDLCRTCSGTTLLVFPRGGSNPKELSREVDEMNDPPRGKTNHVVSEHVRHKPACTITEES